MRGSSLMLSWRRLSNSDGERTCHTRFERGKTVMFDFKKLADEDVANAAILMDEVRPGWATKIDLATLNMGDGGRCVAGQAGLDWQTMNWKFSERHPSKTTRAEDWHISPFSNSDGVVVAAWRREIEARR
jgi:hypothetical protein